MEYESEESVNTILHKLIRTHFIRSHNELEKLGLYPGQPQILLSLSKRDGQSQRELAEIRSVKPSTNTVMLNRMEKAGLIEKRKDSEDQRITRIFLTAKGSGVCHKLKELQKELEEESFKGFSKEEKIVLKRLLIQMIDNIKLENTKVDCRDLRK
ncbi:MarR family winged helix-turn-helix transcriptional regulator [Metaclostridioides mangenotii]|uniref:MarR family winged helix-turn-helix transcriptional regulator n=1 Tax=Metaclostridioides mangenotii TaxID=1540 RepID=UPI000463C6A0|nr:MarR family transcriptional regulator [Clostridioides mangenotii]